MPNIVLHFSANRNKCQLSNTISLAKWDNKKQFSQLLFFKYKYFVNTFYTDMKNYLLSNWAITRVITIRSQLYPINDHAICSWDRYSHKPCNKIIIWYHKSGVKFVCYTREFVITVIVITEFDWISNKWSFIKPF